MEFCIKTANVASLLKGGSKCLEAATSLFIMQMHYDLKMIVMPHTWFHWAGGNL